MRERIIHICRLEHDGHCKKREGTEENDRDYEVDFLDKKSISHTLFKILYAFPPDDFLHRFDNM